MVRENTLIITTSKKKELQAQLDELTNKGRKEIADKLDVHREAITQDDANSYNEALEEKQLLEKRILEITDILEKAKVSDKCESNGNRIGIGCEVTVQLGRKKDKYCIVSSVESDPDKNMISESSPLGKALLGRKKGDEVTISTPKGTEKGKVLKVG